MADTVDSDVEALVTCSVCRQRFDNPWTLAPCLHTFCCKCINKMKTGKSARPICPLCNATSIKSSPDLKTKKLLEVIAKLKKLEQKQGKPKSTLSVDDNCDFKHCKSRAGIYCKDCQIKFCVPCSDKHMRVYAREDHNTEERYRYYHCASHQRRLAVYFCQNCKSSICQVCYLEHERNHTFIKLDDFNKKYAKLKAEAIKLRKVIYLKLNRMEKLKRVYYDHNQKLMEKVKKVHSYLISQMKGCNDTFLKRISDASKEALIEVCFEREIRVTSEFCSKLEAFLDTPIDNIVNRCDSYKSRLSMYNFPSTDEDLPEDVFNKTVSPKIKPLFDQLNKAAQWGFGFVMSELKKIHDEIPVFEEHGREDEVKEKRTDFKVEAADQSDHIEKDAEPDKFNGSTNDEDWETEDERNEKDRKMVKKKKVKKGLKRKSAHHVYFGCKRRKLGITF